ncbi:MAG: haloalkane dehalogenase [Pseudomonadota bacterium]
MSQIVPLRGRKQSLRSSVKLIALSVMLVLSGVSAPILFRSYFGETPDWDRGGMKEHLDSRCFEPMVRRTTEAGVNYVRTPMACFKSLPDWDYRPQHVVIDGLRQGFIEVDRAQSETILLLHGQPSWSYLYRFMIPVLANEGYRVIAMDHLGFGLSDKPIDPGFFTFEKHVERLAEFVSIKELDDIHLFAQDWGSIIGLTLVATDPNRFASVTIANGGIPGDIVEIAPSTHPARSRARFDRMLSMMPEEQPFLFDESGKPLLPVSDSGADDLDAFADWMTYAQTAKSFQPSRIIEALTYYSLTAEERAAYDAPFPDEIAMAAPRTFPSLRNQLIGTTAEKRAALERFEKPFLTIFGGNDPGLAGEGDGQPWMMSSIPGARDQPHHRFRAASHFVQDDIGEEVATRLLAFIAESRSTNGIANERH